MQPGMLLSHPAKDRFVGSLMYKLMMELKRREENNDHVSKFLFCARGGMGYVSSPCSQHNLSVSPKHCTLFYCRPSSYSLGCIFGSD